MFTFWPTWIWSIFNCVRRHMTFKIVIILKNNKKVWTQSAYFMVTFIYLRKQVKINKSDHFVVYCQPLKFCSKILFFWILFDSEFVYILLWDSFLQEVSSYKGRQIEKGGLSKLLMYDRCSILYETILKPA